MEIQFQKTAVPYLQTILNKWQTQEQTQQVRLPDTMPDIGSILASWGQVLIRGKEWQPGGVNITGGIKAWVLYAPEDGTEPCSMELWLPFQMKWDVSESEHDGILTARPMLQGIDARALSSRKMMVRATVGALAHGMLSAQADVYMPEDLPPDVQILQTTYPMLLPVEAGEKAFELEETLPLSNADIAVQKLLRYTADPMLVEYKIVVDKLVLRGVVTLNVFYMGTDGQLYHWNFDLPFSQYTQLDSQYESGAEATVCFAVTDLELEQTEQNDFQLKVGLVAQYTIIEHKEISVAEDIYSPSCSVTAQIQQLQLPAVLDELSHTMHAEILLNDPGQQLVDGVLYINEPHTFTDSDKRQLELSGIAQMLSTDVEGKLQGTLSRWEDAWTISTSDDTQVQLTIDPMEKSQQTANALRADVPLRAMITSQQSIPMVIGAQLGEPKEPDPNRPSLILRGAGNDSLWTLAKEHNTTVEAIRQANGLQQEPLPDQILIIPIS